MLENQQYLSRAPRRVPFSLSVQFLTGGFLNQFGWAFLGFGMIFVWIFVMNADLSSWYLLKDSRTAEGKVAYCSETNMEENETVVYEIGYFFTGPDGVVYRDRSYSTGNFFSEGTPVSIEYAAGNPGISRIKGLRREAFGPLVLFVVIFPLVGAGFVIAGLKKGFKALNLIKNGHLAVGKLISKEPTNTRINDEMVYRYIFEFKTDSGRTFQVESRTHLEDVLEDDEQGERLLYDPYNPECAVTLDDLPGSPEIDSSGNFVATVAGLKVLLLPAVSVFGHGIYIFFRYLS